MQPGCRQCCAAGGLMLTCVRFNHHDAINALYHTMGCLGGKHARHSTIYQKVQQHTGYLAALSTTLRTSTPPRLAKSDNARLDLQSPAVMLLLRASGDVLWLCFTVYRAYAERVHHPIHPLPNNAAITIRPVPTVPTVAAAVARQHILPFFTEIFDALTKLAADSHTEVRETTAPPAFHNLLKKRLKGCFT